MELMFKVLVLFGCCFFVNTEENPKLLLISFDGFRWDYLDLYGPCPNFEKLIRSGTQAQWVKNAFITKTFPNHLTIVTGMYEESHGIIDNRFYDPRLKEAFSFKNAAQQKEGKWFDNGGVPIWMANQWSDPVDGASRLRRSGAIMWPGNEATIHGSRVDKSAGPYNMSITFEDRIDMMIDWFTDPVDPINFCALYFSEPDGTGHKFGPNRPEMKAMIRKLDRLMGYMLQKLRNHNLYSDLNIIVTSDHGMAEMNINRVIEADKFVDRSLYTEFGHSPVWHVIPKEGHEQEVYQAFKKASPHLRVFWREDIPNHFHYKNNARISPILVYTELGWTIVFKKEDLNWPLGVAGAHGFDNERTEMHQFFIAHGPAFQRGYSRGPINIVDIYPLMCHVLKIREPQNNGTFWNVSDIARDPGVLTMTHYILIFVLLGTVAIFGGFVLIIFIQRRRASNNYRAIRRMDDENGKPIRKKARFRDLDSDDDDEL